jgi:hypothetical protein
VNSPLGSVAQASSNPAATLFRGAALPSLLAVVVLALVALPFSPAGSASALVGGAMAMTAMTVPTVLHQFSRRVDPSLMLGIAVLAYFVVIGALGVVYSLINDASWLVGGFAGGGVFAVAAAWTIGQMRAASKLRQPLYQDGELPLGDK